MEREGHKTPKPENISHHVIGRASLVAQRVKNPLQCRRPGFDAWIGEVPGGGKGYPLQCSCLENPMDRGAWRATVHGVAKSRTGLSVFNSFHVVVGNGQEETRRREVKEEGPGGRLSGG